MIVTQEFIKKLGQLGLNSYEAKLWTALLSRGVSTAGELSDIANVPRSRSYDVLESLEKKGFIIQKIGKPIKYVAISPEEVLERVKKNIRKQAEAQATQLDNLKETDILEELTSLHDQGVELIEPTELSGALRDRSSVYEQIATLIKGAQEEVYLVTTPAGLKRKLDVLGREIRKAAERGVKITAIVNGKVNMDQEHVNIIITDTLSARFAVADGQEIVFLLLPDEGVHPSYDVGIWVNAPYFAQAITQVLHLAFPQIKA